MYKLTIKESAFSPLMKVVYPFTGRYLMEKGGAGSGKSERAAAKILLRVLLEKPHRIVCFRKVSKTIRNSQFRLLKDQIKRWGLTKLFDIKETDMSIICKANGNEILAIGLDDREKIKSLTSITSVWVEEITELDEDDFNQIDTRLRGYSQNYKQIYGTFNPISEHHWIRTRFFPESLDDKLKAKRFAYTSKEVKVEDETVTIHTLLTHSNYQDNPFLPPEDKATLESYKEISEQHYKIYALGEWGSIGNLIYTHVQYDEEYPEAYDDVIYGLDFGYNNPTALVKVGIRDKEYYIEDLFYEKKYTNSQLAEAILQLDIKDGSVIYADAAEPARIKELNAYFNEHGRIIDVLPADKSVKDGIDYLQSVKIHTRASNVYFNRELKSYKWKETLDGKVIDGEPVKINDHDMDATRYAIYTHSLSPELKMAFI